MAKKCLLSDVENATTKRSLLKLSELVGILKGRLTYRQLINEARQNISKYDRESKRRNRNMSRTYVLEHTCVSWKRNA